MSHQYKHYEVLADLGNEQYLAREHNGEFIIIKRDISWHIVDSVLASKPHLGGGAILLIHFLSSCLAIMNRAISTLSTPKL